MSLANWHIHFFLLVIGKYVHIVCVEHPLEISVYLEIEIKFRGQPFGNFY
ncbi:hypothetical protein HanIR_Chr16g0816431 [Helianthus annuus]|nr:hypothetical protein HanIR_Chr16g0816431 [Helianthus annuus]